MSMFSPRTSLIVPSVPSGPLPPDRDLMDGLSKNPLQEMSVPKLDKNQEDVCVKDCTYIGSYNWMKGDTPTILVPGQIEKSPLAYTNCADPFLNRFAASVVESDTAVHHTT